MRKIRVVASALFVVASFFAAAPAFAASGGYGAGTGPSDVPGGYANVVTTHTFGLIGGSLFANIPGGQAHLIVPANAFTRDVQLEVTSPDLGSVRAALPHVGFGNYDVVGGIGIKAYEMNGQPFAGAFGHPLTLAMTGAAFGVGDQVIRFTGASTAIDVGAEVSPGSVTVLVLEDPDFAILAPLVSAATTAASSTASASPSGAAVAPPTAASSAGVAPAPSASASASPSVLGEQFTSTGGGHSSAAEVGWIALAVVAIAVGIITLRNRQHEVYAGRHGQANPAHEQRHGGVPDGYVQRHRQQRT
jgi:hypothetical protein